ncbi:MAG: VOC family protein [Chlorobi bacterium]|nr:VOC family protein [Chlorobiota bacterium]MCI0715878.1 VOC family protein [Chlorobiota bacterium]
MKIPDDTKIQSVDLKIKDLEISVNFYSTLLGFKEIERRDYTSLLSANGNHPYLISLTEAQNSIPKPRGTTGLFHIAIRFPNRKELARVFLRLFDHKIKFQGFSDHLVSEAIYLTDPDENGIELYADKPRSEWVWHMGQIQMDTLPLNLNVITSELDDRNVWNGIHPETDIGHIHLRVSNLQKAEEFYFHLLGLNITSSTYNGAIFFAADKYHHHVGTNIWQSKNGFPPPENSVGLISYTIKIPDKDYLIKLEQSASEQNLLIEPFTGKHLILLDFDKNKIRLTL